MEKYSSSPKKRKNKSKASTFDVQKMKEERNNYYKGLQEIQELKNSYHQLVNSESPKETEKGDEEIVCVLTSAADIHPGRKVFCPSKRYQCYSKGILASEKTERLSFDDLRYFLQIKAYGPIVLSEYTICKLFKIMSIDDDFLVCDSCFQVLVCNVDIWRPKLSDIFQVLLNWGATTDSLGLTIYEKSIIFPENDGLHILESCDNKQDFCNYNYEKITCYLTSVVQQKPSTFSEIEKLILVKAFIRVALDQKGSMILFFIKDLISICMDSLNNWSSFKVVNVTSYLHDDTEDFHNQIATVTSILPKISKCNDICSCLSFTILKAMIKSEVNYVFPVKNHEILGLIKTIKVEEMCKENLLKLYLVVHLVNYMVCHQNIASENNVLKEIKTSLDALKWEVVRNHKTFDADLLKGRITYCSSLWSLLQ